MLKSIIRAMIMSRARSAAEHVLRHIDDATLKDIGHDRHSFVAASVEAVRKDLDNMEQQKAAPINQTLWGLCKPQVCLGGIFSPRRLILPDFSAPVQSKNISNV